MALRRLFRREPEPQTSEAAALTDDASASAAPIPAPSVPTPYPSVAAEVGDSADIPHRHVFQDNQTDMDFLLQRADRPSTLANLDPGSADSFAAGNPAGELDVDGIELDDALDL